MKEPSSPAGIELYGGVLTPDGNARDLLQYLCPLPEEAQLPAKVEVGHDTLRLVNHTEMHQARATQLCNSLSYVCSQAADLYPEVRRGVAAGEELELPRLRIGDFHEYGLRYSADKETGGVRYVFYRADEGANEGGFYVIKQTDGTIVLARGQHHYYTPPQGTSDYAHVLLQANRAVEVYAKTLAISTEELNRQMHQDHLSTARLSELSSQVAKESTRRYKLKNRLSRHGRTALYQASRLVTAADPEAKMQVPPGRKLSKARIALIALALPIPGYSGTIGDTPVPRPASMAVAADIAGVAADLWPDKAAPAPDPVALYDERQLDLPDASIVAMNETGQEVLLLDRSPEVPTAVPVISSSEATASLGGESPRRVVIDEVLGSQACARLQIAPDSQNRPISFATTDPAVSQKAEIDVSPEAVYLCNTTDEIIASGELQFYFDTRD